MIKAFFAKKRFSKYSFIKGGGKKMKKRVLSLLLVSMMSLGLFVGCGNDSSDSNVDASISSETAVSEEATSSEETTSSEEVKKEVVELRLLCFGTMSERMEDFFDGEFHDKVLDELQIDMTVEFLPFNSQSEITTMLAGGDSFAFLNVPTSWPAFINDGYILDIDPEQVAEIAPNYINSRAGMGFDCVKVEDKYWALPLGSKVMVSDGANISIRNDILEEVGASYDQITTYDELMDVLADVHEQYPDMCIWPGVNATAKMLPTEVCPEGTYYLHLGNEFVIIDQLSGEAIPNFGSEFFENVCRLNAKFYELGYSSKDLLTDSSFSLAQWNAGNSLVYNGYAEKVINHELAGVEGSDQRFVKIGDLPLVKSRDFDWAVSFAKGEADNLDRWFEFFDWIYANEENYLFSIYGVEGEDWNYGSKGEVVGETSDFMLSYYTFGSMYYDTYPDKDPEDVAAYKAMESDDVILDVKLGFKFDKSVNSELETIEAAVKTIRSEKILPVLYGFADYDSEIDGILEELNKVGYQTYCEEYIKQFNEWKASK